MRGHGATRKIEQANGNVPHLGRVDGGGYLFETPAMIDIEVRPAVFGEPDILKLHNRPAFDEAEVPRYESGKLGKRGDVGRQQHCAKFDACACAHEQGERL